MKRFALALVLLLLASVAGCSSYDFTSRDLGDYREFTVTVDSWEPTDGEKISNDLWTKRGGADSIVVLFVCKDTGRQFAKATKASTFAFEGSQVTGARCP